MLFLVSRPSLPPSRDVILKRQRKEGRKVCYELQERASRSEEEQHFLEKKVMTYTALSVLHRRVRKN